MDNLQKANTAVKPQSLGNDDAEKLLNRVATTINAPNFDAPWKKYEQALTACFVRLQSRTVRAVERKELDAARKAMAKAVETFNDSLTP